MLTGAVSATAADFTTSFRDSTLRVDYIFGGGPQGVHIMQSAQSKSAGWAGRRARLNELFLAGNGEIQVLDPLTADTLYRNPFSTLFQEWLEVDEAATTQRSFQNTFIVPLPKCEADIRVILRDNRRKEIASLTTRYSPADELVAIKGRKPLPHKYLHRGAEPDKAIDIAILAEGYTVAETDSFLTHAQASADEIMSYEPFASNKDRLNFVAVMSPSAESGVSIPLSGNWKDTAFGSHFSTFHTPRYLTVPNVHALHDALAGIPYEHIMIVVNTDNYGGGGIFNSYHIAAAKNEHTLPVTVHEFGHSFAGLADEYFYPEEEGTLYVDGVEPWEPNITTLTDFSSKWEDMLATGEPTVGVFEGGGYRVKGVWRPAETCRMRDNYYLTFCPVCRRAIARLIDFYAD